MLIYNQATDTSQQSNNPFFGFDWNEDIPNPALRQLFNTDREKIAYYAFKTYGVHTHKGHTLASWRQMEEDWKSAGIRI